ncbi:PREDICTED: QWRF motif-containing protein 3 [Populus euphratica]|uniref:QWRF motif-containing protein 3 n=1 Tax=Populus euphratica TaxID=75702 RepID=A0AAJ6VEB3_POPEU|nr:PREDICTED: QWRF motif-containing protein 3 [Populus euphratica]
MKNTENEPFLLSSDQSLKPRRPKSREVSSRFLSPTSPSHNNGTLSPNQGSSSPLRPKPSSDVRKHRSLDDPGFIRGLWPSSSPSQSSNNQNNQGTLADHLGNARLKDLLDHKKDEKPTKSSSVFSLGRQRSNGTVFGRVENDKEKGSTKENHRPILGGSARYTGKFHFPGKSSSSSSSSSSNSSSNNNPVYVPGRLSVDENALYKNSKEVGASRRNSDIFEDNLESEISECSDKHSGNDLFSPTLGRSSRKSGVEVSSKYMNDIPTRPRRWTTDANAQTAVSLESSPKIKKLTMKNVIKRANSLTGYGSATSQWALSPGRSGSPPMSGEVRLMQWRYANVRAATMNLNINKQVENNLLWVLDGLSKLRHSVAQRRLKLQKEKLKMKLDFVLHSQIKLLEAWGDMERQHLSSVSKTKESLHSVVCRVPLIEGAEVDPQSASIALRHASDLSASIKSALSSFSSTAEQTVTLLSQLAEVVAQEKLLMEECHELLQTVSALQIQEKSLKCYIIQFNSKQQQLQQQEQQSQLQETPS